MDEQPNKPLSETQFTKIMCKKEFSLLDVLDCIPLDPVITEWILNYKKPKKKKRK